ncbi:MAG: hypothetical protein ACTJHU_03615 [Mycetocola sp.]
MRRALAGLAVVLPSILVMSGCAALSQEVSIGDISVGRTELGLGPMAITLPVSVSEDVVVSGFSLDDRNRSATKALQ